jgi:hypothetical protein
MLSAPTSADGSDSGDNGGEAGVEASEGVDATSREAAAPETTYKRARRKNIERCNEKLRELGLTPRKELVPV